MDDPTGPADLAAAPDSPPTAGEVPDERGTGELDRARERLAFYESFDRLIQENIGRAAELLRQAMSLRESTAAELAEARAELARQATASRERERATLTAVRDELGELEGRVGALSRRVADALGALEAAASGAGGGSTGEAVPPESMPDEAAMAAVTLDPAFEPFEPPAGDLPTFSVVPPPSPMIAADLQNGAAVGPADEPDAGASADPGFAAEAESEAPTPYLPTGRTTAGRSIVVLVHGVPRAATALSLQRYLAALDHVEAVEAREYAEGILRLQVIAEPPLRLDDLQRWEGGGPLEPLHVLDDVIEVRMPGATGL